MKHKFKEKESFTISRQEQVENETPHCPSLRMEPSDAASPVSNNTLK
jgi:hypothetical protein